MAAFGRGPRVCFWRYPDIWGQVRFRGIPAALTGRDGWKAAAGTRMVEPCALGLDFGWFRSFGLVAGARPVGRSA